MRQTDNPRGVQTTVFVCVVLGHVLLLLSVVEVFPDGSDGAAGDAENFRSQPRVVVLVVKHWHFEKWRQGRICSRRSNVSSKSC